MYVRFLFVVGLSALLFGCSSDQVKDEQQVEVEDLSASASSADGSGAMYLSQNRGTTVTLEGHADERGSREYNLALGERRAQSIKQQMLLLGASAGQIRLVSYGEERPAVDGHDDYSWQQNRRVEILY